MWARLNTRGVRPVLAVSDFHASINKEKSRTDRTGLSFSLVLLKLDSSHPHPAAWRLIRLVRRRIREVDIIGWFDQKHIAVLLPSTDLEGGRKLADSLSDLLKGRGIAAFMSFFSYPAQKREMQMICEQISSIA